MEEGNSNLQLEVRARIKEAPSHCGQSIETGRGVSTVTCGN